MLYLVHRFHCAIHCVSGNDLLFDLLPGAFSVALSVAIVVVNTAWIDQKTIGQPLDSVQRTNENPKNPLDSHWTGIFLEIFDFIDASKELSMSSKACPFCCPTLSSTVHSTALSKNPVQREGYM